MGRSVTCNFQVTLKRSDGVQPIYGAMTLKDIRGIILSENDFLKKEGKSVVTAEIWPQTKGGQRYMKKDFAIMHAKDFAVDHYYVDDRVPFYTL